MLKLKVADSEGARIGLLRAIWRNVAKSISGLLFPVAIGMVVLTAERRSLHDTLAGTWVSKPATE